MEHGVQDVTISYLMILSPALEIDPGVLADGLVRWRKLCNLPIDVSLVHEFGEKVFKDNDRIDEILTRGAEIVGPEKKDWGTLE
jgi:hypothetical protein